LPAKGREQRQQLVGAIGRPVSDQGEVVLGEGDTLGGVIHPVAVFFED
jgi:hypothetical protein